MKKPHILIFNPDQMRADSMQHLGNEAAVTPNLDRLAKEGVSFSQAFCQNPVCTPSRCSFMSGWYPHVRGHRSMHFMMQKDEPVLLKILKDNGYYVWWGGKNDLIAADKDIKPYCNEKFTPSEIDPNKVESDYKWQSKWRGEFKGNNYYSFYAGKTEKEESSFVKHDWLYVNAAVEKIKSYKEDKPLCIYLPLLYPHPPYAVEEPFYSMIDRNKVSKCIEPFEDWTLKPSILKGIYDRQDLKNWSSEDFVELKSTYLGMCARIDYQFGLIVNALKEAGIYDETAIFVFSDHGDFTGDYGLVEKTQNTFEDCLTNIPLIIKPPSNLDCKPRTTEALAELVDIPATISEIADVNLDYNHYGKSLVPVLKGEEIHKDYVFCEGGRIDGEPQCMELGHKETSLYWPRLSIQASDGPEHKKAVMIRNHKYKYVYRLEENDEFYNLEKDPHEKENLIQNRKYENEIQILKDRLFKFMIETSDVVPLKKEKRR
ncbi:sulfatase-like hydrolase/transferase [Maledivibacter halophilus]|uniref:Arylsulfatase A n=1 Tax=Maledivibacter halophilus TaxID=36842 RepID=A0A1T5M469_9FIRM|nr:sulfatase-like hydrolase/transferase [Maledivibacter halophilus]SKC83047.1 Arylsulfatase A [Maledivibacter halophilus]